ncbi:MAG: ABC transporter ATP-binding protein [Candidatus Dormibacteraeota bacterium]|nr:ABC transporter ATP-binding protein [Candidatus Dormibacteraeota bacterium]
MRAPSTEGAPADVAAPPPVAGDDTPAIHAVGLTKHYGHITALSGLTMSVPRGEIFGFLGPNGAGKTTAVKLLLGLTAPTAGEAWLLGEPVGRAEARRGVGYLPELFRYPAWLSPVEVLRFHCRLIGIAKPLRRDEIDDALHTVGLSERADDRVGTFSKGMQQRLGLAVAMLGRPEVVFLDEPTSALDPVGRHDVRSIIRGLRDRGTAVLLNSHLLSEVEQVCDRVAVVDHGRVVASGTLDEILGGVVVRVRVTGVDEPADVLGRWGDVTADGEWLNVRGVEGDGVADMVAELVRRGGRVHAVEPQRQSLEDRFLEVLRDNDDEGAP